MEKQVCLRRKKKEYICPCGKQYYSYPALYTHIKTVHNGKAPGDIRRPEIPSRGRPKLSGPLKISQYSRKMLQSFADSPIYTLQSLTDHQQTPYNQTIIKIINQNKIYLNLLTIDKQSKPIQHIQSQNLNNILTGQGILQFLGEVKSIIISPIVNQIQLVILIFLEHVIEQSEDPQILTTSSLPFIIDFANDFVIHGFQPKIEKIYQKCKQKKDQSNEDQHEQSCQVQEELWMSSKQNMLMTLDVLFKWMNYKHYTLTKAKLNTHYI